METNNLGLPSVQTEFADTFYSRSEMVYSCKLTHIQLLNTAMTRTRKTIFRKVKLTSCIHFYIRGKTQTNNFVSGPQDLAYLPGQKTT